MGEQMKAFIVFTISIFAFIVFTPDFAWSQQPSSNAAAEQAAQHTAAEVTPLMDLIDEVRAKSPEIMAATHAYRAARNVPRQAGALPDTTVVAQQLSVGSPRPFAGYTNNNFAYIGLGISQEIPYPGKRRLRAEVASREADSAQAQVEAVNRNVIERLKTTYFHLAYIQQALAILQKDDQLLGELEQITESRYRVGQGNQQEVLKAQLQHTRLLQQIAMEHREEGELQAQLKQLLDREQESADIITAALSPRTITYTPTQLFQLARKQSPEIGSREAMLKRAQSQVKLARKEFRPDFDLQYMYQNTDRKFPDYYMLTFGVHLPNRGRRRAELAEAQEDQERADQELQGEIQSRMADIQEQLVVVRTSEEQLKIYKEGLIPQAQAEFRSALAAFQSNRQDFAMLLSSFLDVLSLETDYQRELADHESALARIESLTGVTLP